MSTIEWILRMLYTRYDSWSNCMMYRISKTQWTDTQMKRISRPSTKKGDAIVIQQECKCWSCKEKVKNTVGFDEIVGMNIRCMLDHGTIVKTQWESNQGRKLMTSRDIRSIVLSEEQQEEKVKVKSKLWTETDALAIQLGDIIKKRR
jgi:hypothetical protein